MNIFFKMAKEIIDVRGESTEGIIIDIDSMDIPDQTKSYLRKLRYGMMSRFSLILSEINGEESSKLCYVLVDLTTGDTGIKYFGYSTSLVDKLKYSFTDKDLTHFFSIGM